MSVRVIEYRGAWHVRANSRKFGPSGRRQVRFGTTEADKARAEAFAQELREQLGEGLEEPTRVGPIGIEEACRHWLAVNRKTLKPTTAESYAALIRTWIGPFFGSRDLRKLRRIDAMEFIEHVVGEQGRAVGTARNVLRLVARVASALVDDGALDRHPLPNLGELLRKIETAQASEAKVLRVWTGGELEQILDLAREKEPTIYPLLLTLAHSGMRRGEAIGLTWSEVDFARNEITVCRRVSQGKVGTPKGRTSRKVTLSPRLADELGALRRNQRRGRLQGRLAPADGWVFLGKRGRSRIGETTLFRAWCRLRDRFEPFEITPLRLHDLRHTWASLAIEGGLPIPWVAEQLGHADAATTLRIYAHVMPRPEVDFRFLGAAEVGRNKSVTGRNKSPVEAEAGSG